MSRKRKRKQFVNPDDLAPKIAEGLTQDASAREAMQEHPPSTNPSGIEIASTFSNAVRESEDDPRSKRVHFIVRVDTDTVVIEPNTGRKMFDVEVILPPEHRRQILAGYRCINCYERFDYAFPLHCPVCGYEVRDRQIQRAAQEFEGDVHVGPKKPIRRILEERDLEAEKRDFRYRLEHGGSRMKGL